MSRRKVSTSVIGLAGQASDADPLDRLGKLNELRLAGVLTESEFEAQKARILSGE